jgi:hypothetical protein
LTERSKVLPANADDPRFRNNRKDKSTAEWNAKDAIMTAVTDPIDYTRSSTASEYVVSALIESVLTAALELTGDLIGHLSHH